MTQYHHFVNTYDHDQAEHVYLLGGEPTLSYRAAPPRVLYASHHQGCRVAIFTFFVMMVIRTTSFSELTSGQYWKSVKENL